ncbi:MAG TPA: VWA domain-containing protein [Thermoanaerobaculia bacterium]|nr:VWA domain-containing protein [Thermoanaerobaculia bacterium]
MRQAVLAVFLALATTAGAQEPPAQTFNETVSVGYVMIPFTALARNGAPITNLKERDVALYVDGKRAGTDMFEESMNAPVSFTILLDASGSMALAGKMDAARAAVSTLLAHKKKGDDFALYVFAESEAHEVVPFTEDGDLIRRALFDVKPYGKTAFFDALATMPDRNELGKNPTRAMILLSDGIDNASRTTREGLARIFEGSSIPIYPLGLRDPAELKPHQPVPYEELSDLDLLEAVAILTGGKLNLGRHPEQLERAVESMQKDLRAQYLIGFSPTGKGEVKYRRIAVQLAGRARVVRVRAGYRGTEPPALTSSASRGKTRTEKKGSSQ